MKTVDKLVAMIDRQDLAKAVLEIKEWQDTGLLKQDGVFRKAVEEVAQGYGLPYSDMMRSVENAIVMRAAVLWATEAQ